MLNPISLSPDGTCGSTSGYCGTTTAHCTTGCQSAFGTCTSTPTSSTAPRPSDVSPDGTCGGTKNLKCANSDFGDCCSKTGFCGDTISHCAQGCQTKFATKCLTTNIPTLDGSCGSTKGSFTCAGGPFDGQCCSAGGFCGSTTDHCKAASGWYVEPLKSYNNANTMTTKRTSASVLEGYVDGRHQQQSLCPMLLARFESQQYEFCDAIERDILWLYRR
jgi:hypothetical protein